MEAAGGLAGAAEVAGAQPTSCRLNPHPLRRVEVPSVDSLPKSLISLHISLVSPLDLSRKSQPFLVRILLILVHFTL